MIWIDLTTTRALRDRGPVGITRVERAFARAALAAFGQQIRFIHFDRYQDAWLEFDAPRAAALLAPTTDRSRSGHGARVERGTIAGLAHRMEQAARPTLRRLSGIGLRAVGRAARVARFGSGDTIVLLGDTATQRGTKQLVDATRGGGCRLVAMCYDLIPWRLPHYFSDAASVQRFCENLVGLLPHVDAMIVPSHATARDLQAFAAERDQPAPNVKVIALGSNSADLAAPRQPEWADALLASGFVLCVGTVQVRKNHRLLYNVWRRMAERGVPAIPPLVLAGDAGWLTGDVRSLIANDPLTRDRIRLTGAIDDAELAWLYRHCRFSVYPSLYEGWGLPVAEGLAAGRPCIASSSSSIPEAGAGLATLVDPLDFAGWYEAVCRHAGDDAFVRDCVDRIKRAPPLLDWSAAAQGFVALLGGVARAA